MLSRAIGSGACDWEWSGGGGVQEDGWEEVEADGGAVEGGQTQRKGGALLPPLLRPLEKILNAGKVKGTKTLPKKL